MFIALANEIYDEQGELTSENLADFAKNRLQTGEWSFTGGLVMDEYKMTPETAPAIVRAGADALVAGSAVFKGDPNAYAANVAAIREAADRA